MEPALGWTYGQFLPEITEPLLENMRMARALDKRLRELRRDIHQDVAAQWTSDEIDQAKKAAQDEYERATGKSLRTIDLRVC
jgi:hypothetical protein